MILTRHVSTRDATRVETVDVFRPTSVPGCTYSSVASGFVVGSVQAENLKRRGYLSHV